MSTNKCPDRHFVAHVVYDGSVLEIVLSGATVVLLPDSKLGKLPSFLCSSSKLIGIHLTATIFVKAVLRLMLL